jgi:hypothetical protein
MTRAAILQSSYIPWKGYFDLINLVDEFVLYDDVQYTTRDWRSRNRIKTRTGTRWLTIPILTRGRFGQRVLDATIADSRWAIRHWRSHQMHYGRAEHFVELSSWVQGLYSSAIQETRLSRINELFIRSICDILGIATRIRRSEQYELPTERNDRLIRLCELVGAEEYVSGPAARAYLDEEKFENRDIRVRWMDYTGYPEYSQLHSPPFDHNVTILDVLFNVGPRDALGVMLSGGGREIFSTAGRTGT